MAGWCKIFDIDIDIIDRGVLLFLGVHGRRSTRDHTGIESGSPLGGTRSMDAAALIPQLEALLKQYGVKGISVATLHADGRCTALAVGDADARAPLSLTTP